MTKSVVLNNQALGVKVCGYTCMFFHPFLQRGTTFATRFPSLKNEVVSKEVYTEMKKFSPTGSNSFLVELTPIDKGGKNRNGSCVP